MDEIKRENIKKRLIKYSTIDDFSGCWIWNKCLNNWGYGRIFTDKPRTAHRVSFEVFNGPIIDNLCVLHKCDNPACINPFHLFLGTLKDNMRDMFKKGRSYYQKNPESIKRVSDAISKLNKDSVKDIRKNYSYRHKKFNAKYFADKYNVNQQTIMNVVHGIHYGHIK